MNEIYEDGSTLLSRMCRCTIQFGQKLQAFEFDTLLLDFIQKKGLRNDTIDRSLRHSASEESKGELQSNEPDFNTLLMTTSSCHSRPRRQKNILIHFVIIGQLHWYGCLFNPTVGPKQG